MSPPRRRRAPAARVPDTARPPLSRLLRTTIAAVRHIESVRGLDEQTQRTEAQRVDRSLRAAVDAHPTRRVDDVPGLSAVRVGCAHLAVGDLDSAHQALVTARGLLR